MEQITCPISGTSDFTLLYELPDRFALDKCNQWKVVQSVDSGLVFLNPRPSPNEIGAYYDALDYDPFITLKQNASAQDRFYKFVREFISLRYKAKQILKRTQFQSGKFYRVLDIGTATGDFLLEVGKQSRHAQIELYGIEYSEKASRYAREVNGLNVQTGELISSGFETPMDLITMWHTLEHILSINETLEHLARILKSSGTLAVAMPNFNSTDRKHYERNWVALDAPRHLYHFTPTTFAKLLAKHHLEIIDMHGLPLDSYYNCLLSEQLKSATQNQSGGIGTLLNSIVFGTLSAIQGFDANEASSIVYYIRHSK